MKALHRFALARLVRRFLADILNAAIYCEKARLTKQTVEKVFTARPPSVVSRKLEKTRWAVTLKSVSLEIPPPD